MTTQYHVVRITMNLAVNSYIAKQTLEMQFAIQVNPQSCTLAYPHKALQLAKYYVRLMRLLDHQGNLIFIVEDCQIIEVLWVIKVLV